ncbi:hypothetical protein MMC13_002648 [Lambiella insularis]|nr:hypothetical protein [Lambiella insularis]
MSNYHGMHNFGGLYNYNGQFPLPLPPPPPQQVGPYGMTPQSMYPQHHGRPPIPPLQSFQPPQYNTQYNYSTSSSFPSSGTPGSSAPPPPPFAYHTNFGAYATNGMPPPPPFPTIPIPHHNISSQRLAASIPLPTSPSAFSPQTGLPPKPAAVVETSDNELGNGNAHGTSREDREDGELSDAGRCRTLSDAGSTKPGEVASLIIPDHSPMLSPNDDSMRPQKGIAIPSKFSEPNQRPLPSSTNDTNNPNISSPRVDSSRANVAKAQFEATTNREISESRENFPSTQLSTDRFTSGTGSLHGRVSPKFALPQPSVDLHNHNRYHVLLEKAKSALLDLHRAKIRYQQLLAEGLEASLLQGLYQEIGLEVDDLTATTGPVSHTGETLENNTTVEATQSVGCDFPTVPASDPLSAARSTAVLSQPGEASLSSKVLPEEVPEIVSISSNSTLPAVSKGSTARQTDSGPALAVQPGKPAGINTAKSPSFLSGGDRALERKDYIAKMLAAKAGKGVNTRTTKVTEPAGAMQESDAKQKGHTETTTHHSDETSQATTTSGLSNSGVDINAKKKASTDRARRKTEALTTQSNEGHSAPLTNTVASQAPAKHTQLSHSTSPEARVVSNAGSLTPIDTQIIDQPAAFQDLSSSQQYTPLTPFFAKLERKSTIGLPGLTMSYQTLPKPLAQPGVVVALPTTAPSPQSLQSSASNSVLQSRSPSLPALQAPGSKVSLQSSTVADTSATELTGIPRSQIVILSGSRKRAIAADFIDGPSHSSKRTAGSNGHVEVVIEVSEDEGFAEDDEMDIDTHSPSQPQRTGQNLSNMPRVIRDLPALSNFPPRTNTAIVSSISTPPLVQTPGKSSEPEELVRAEEKIRLLKQMIAEKEERQRAKLTSSRAQSPGSINQTIVGVPLAREISPARSSSGCLAIEQRKRVLDAVNKDLQDQKSVLAATETAVQGKLEAEETAHAAVAAKAELEGLEASQATTAAERQYREKRRGALEAALPELDYQIQVAKGKLDNLRSQKEELEAEIERGSQGRRRILEELDTLLATLEVDKTMAELSPIQPPIPDTRAGSADSESLRLIFDTKITGEPEDKQGISVESDQQVTSPVSILSTATQIITEGNDEQSAPLANGLLSRSVTADQVMDISSPSSDGVPPIDFNQSNPSERQVSVENDTGYEDYEPRLENDILSQETAETDVNMPLIPDESSNDAAPLPVQRSPGSESMVVPDLKGLERDNISLEDGEVSRSISPDNADDSDDYEPPEPLPIVDNRAASQESEVFGPKSPLPETGPVEEGTDPDKPPDKPPVPARESPLVELTADFATEAEAPVTHEVHHESASLQADHYTPYKSPLSIFTSYRYHPGYISEVSGGFRSLTYSHKINPKEPLCRWELAGGMCNDNSCKDQHFRSMYLTGAFLASSPFIPRVVLLVICFTSTVSIFWMRIMPSSLHAPIVFADAGPLTIADDMILVQLGSIHEGSTLEEKNAYVNGLKKIISDMRSRRVTDFNTVAQEITAYRASFLGDSSRVLTL